MDAMGDVLLDIDGGPGTDPEELAQLAGLLMDELRGLDVDDVRPAPGGAAPSGAKGLEGVLVGRLIVKLGPVAVGVLVRVVRRWADRSDVARVALRIGDDEIVVDRATTQQRDRLIELFVTRHAAAPDGGTGA
jgi:hypothetical protein